MKTFVSVGMTVAIVCLLLCPASSALAADAEALLSETFDQAGPLDPQTWQMTNGTAPECRDGQVFNSPQKMWNSGQTFSEPVSVEFSGEYLSQTPRSGANALALAPGGWGPEMVCWVFDGSNKDKPVLAPLWVSGGADGWRDAYRNAIELSTLPDVTKKENALTLRIDWWPGKIVRYYLNSKLVTQYLDNVPSQALPVGVRDESVGFRLDGIRVTKLTQSADDIMRQIQQEQAAAEKARDDAAKVRREARRARISVMDAPPAQALLLHLDGGDKVKDSSVFGFVMEPKSVTYEKGRFGSAAKFDGKESQAVLDTPMIEKPGYQYVSFCFQRQTVECWIRPDRTGNDETLLGAVLWVNPNDDKHRSQGWHLFRNKEDHVGLNWGGYVVAGSTPVPAGEWTHVAAVIDVPAAKATLYVNGKEDGATRIGLISTGGKFLLGAGDSGRYQGCLDEVAVHSAALSADQVAARAKASSAIADPKVEPRFYALPANDHTFAFLNHGSIPGNWMLFRLPEYATNQPGVGGREARSVCWTWEDGGWTYTWGVSGDEKKAKQLDFKGRIIPGTDSVVYEMTVTNPGATPWKQMQMLYECMRCTDAPSFRDLDGTHTFIRRNGAFITMLDAMGGKLVGSVEKGSLVGGGNMGPLLARRSMDQQWSLAVITDNSFAVADNFIPEASCMHSNPDWPLMKPGETRTNAGCVYLLLGGLEDIWKRCQAEFGLRDAAK